MSEHRHDVERSKWDAYARRSLDEVKALPPDVDFESFCAQEQLLEGIPDFLGPLDGKRVVEYGCGLGKLTVLLARSGAHVSAFGISSESVAVARERARLVGVDSQINFDVAAGESLPYEDASFDVAFGMAVIHHLDPLAGSRELRRIVRPGGLAAFSEPLGTNPLIRFARDHLPYRDKTERGADIPLRRSDIRAWTAPFSEAKVHGIQLVSMIERAFGYGSVIRPLRRVDRVLLTNWPGLWPLARYCTMTMIR